jgi:hypothetical protein
LFAGPTPAAVALGVVRLHASAPLLLREQQLAAARDVCVIGLVFLADLEAPGEFLDRHL